MKEYRKKELEKYKSTWLTVEGYSLLVREREKQEKSMMRLIDNLIKEAYGNATLRKVPREQLDDEDS